MTAAPPADAWADPIAVAKYGTPEPFVPLTCTWRRKYSGAVCRCSDLVVPGELFCAEHFIEEIAQ